MVKNICVYVGIKNKYECAYIIYNIYIYKHIINI